MLQLGQLRVGNAMRSARFAVYNDDDAYERRAAGQAQHVSSGVDSTSKCVPTGRLDCQNPSSTAKKRTPPGRADGLWATAGGSGVGCGVGHA